MADERYWTYQAGSPTPAYVQVPVEVFRGTQAQWEALSPGMRREIVREFTKRKQREKAAELSQLQRDSELDAELIKAAAAMTREGLA